MFTPVERERIAALVLDRARRDSRVIGAALTGSAAGGLQDRWSDIDIVFGLAHGLDTISVVDDWSAWIDAELNAIHHFDVRHGATIYRVFLLKQGLELDVAFAPAVEFGALGPQFRVVFGQPVVRPPASGVDCNDLIGRGWHHVLHARASIERGHGWQAEYWISALRDHTLALACARLGERIDYAKGIHRLPRDVTEPLERGLVRSLTTDELRRALGVVVVSFLHEVQEAAPDLASHLTTILTGATN